MSNYFNDIEWNSILKTSKEASEYHDEYDDELDWTDAGLDEDLLFALSVQEARIYAGRFPSVWPESPYFSYYLRSFSGTQVGMVGDPITGGVHIEPTSGFYDGSVRSAFNLNTNNILFASNPTDDSSSSKAGTLSSIPSYGGGSWKLTLLDGSRDSFTANVAGQKSASVGQGGSLNISYAGAKTGDNEFVTAILCDGDGDAIYYGTVAQNSESGTVSLAIPSDLPVGSYTLKVFSEQRSGDYKSDYASEFQDIALDITLPQEATPQAVFAATGEDSGILSNIEIGMKYSTDGGSVWNDVTDANTDLSDVTSANDVKVYTPGNGTTTSDSTIQTIDITQPDKPEATGVDCTTLEQNDGQITNVDSTMEYRPSAASEWNQIAGTAVTGLVNGTYEVRVKTKGTALASAATTVTIGEHVCAAQGEWQYDKDGHWKLCSCGEKVEEGTHSGGEATCLKPATCEVCGQPYGEEDLSNHKGEKVWSVTPTTHARVWSCCEAVIVEETEHTWENGTCTVCGYEKQAVEIPATGGGAVAVGCRRAARARACGGRQPAQEGARQVA